MKTNKPLYKVVEVMDEKELAETILTKDKAQKLYDKLKAKGAEVTMGEVK